MKRQLPFFVSSVNDVKVWELNFVNLLQLYMHFIQQYQNKDAFHWLSFDGRWAF